MPTNPEDFEERNLHGEERIDAVLSEVCDRLTHALKPLTGEEGDAFITIGAIIDGHYPALGYEVGAFVEMVEMIRDRLWHTRFADDNTPYGLES